jgi:hypothetical protein
MRTHTAAVAIALLFLCGSVATTGGVGSLFPEIPGWKLMEEETVYGPDNLWDAIDGAADLYLEYSFVDLHIGRYSKSDDLEIKVELYKHGSLADAFGIYSQERNTDYHFIDLGTQGYVDKGVLNFLCGTYYVKISTLQSGKDAQEALLMIGRKVEEHLNQPKGWPEPLRMLPSSGKETNSEQYIAKNFLGYGSLGGAYVASYIGKTPFKLFIIQRASPAEAKQILDDYVNALPKGAATEGEGGRFEVRDPHHGRLEILLKNRYLAGLVGCSGSGMCEKYLKGLEANLTGSR